MADDDMERRACWGRHQAKSELVPLEDMPVLRAPGGDLSRRVHKQITWRLPPPPSGAGT